jgi:hypothetical protein
MIPWPNWKAPISDPPGQRNFYRISVVPMMVVLKTAFSSVTEDLFFDGKTFDFSLFNPATDDGDVDPDEFGLYFSRRLPLPSNGATWMRTILISWNTLEYSNSNQGPFSGYTRLDTNINGGLGIWGGYSVSYYKASRSLLSTDAETII